MASQFHLESPILYPKLTQIRFVLTIRAATYTHNAASNNNVMQELRSQFELILFVPNATLAFMLLKLNFINVRGEESSL